MASRYTHIDKLLSNIGSNPGQNRGYAHTTVLVTGQGWWDPAMGPRKAYKDWLVGTLILINYLVGLNPGRNRGYAHTIVLVTGQG